MSGDCRSREEEIYWTHFQCIHFSQFLNAGFDQQLAIPENFTKNLKRKLPDIVTLKGPSGASWKVGLTANNDTFFFNHGWEEFVKDHFLEENDFLIFKYNGVSNFDVLMFDKQSMCEKAASYFVRKCEHTEHDNGCQTKRKTSKNSVEVMFASPHDEARGSQPEKSTSNDIDTIPLGQPIISQVTNKKSQREYNLTKPIRARWRVRGEERSACDDKIEAKRDIEYAPHSPKAAQYTPHSPKAARWRVRGEERSACDDKIEAKRDIEYTPLKNEPDIEYTPHSPKAAHSLRYASSRRPATKEEEMNALLSAQAAVTDEGFLAVMKPTHVSRRFYMSIPSAWFNKHLFSLEHQDMHLRFKEKTWHAKFYYHKVRNSGGLSSGWRNFAVDNNLHECDVCVFEPGGLVNNSIVLDVGIFRAVQQANPVDD